MSIKKNPLLF